MVLNNLGNARDRVASPPLLAGIGLAVLLAVVPTSSASGQDTLQVGEQPRVHIVQDGETLWELARLYFGDPFLWPEIYRINTQVVEDPHWIFPGEELRLVIDTTMVVAEGPVEPPPGEVGDTVEVTPREPEPEQPPPETPPVDLPDAPPPPPPVEQDAPTVFAQTQPVAEGGIELDATERYRAVRQGDFYAAGFLTEGQSLPWATVQGRVDRRGTGEVDHSAQIYERIRIRAPRGATYHVGDSLLTARLSREVPDWGRIVVPTGIARVVYESGRDVIAEVVSMFGRITEGQVAMPVEPFRDPGNARPGPVADGMSGTVIEPRDRQTVPNPQDIVFIDLGRQDGVVPGDVFEMVRPARDRVAADAPLERVALLQIVHVREQSASGLLLHIKLPGVHAGVPVRLIGKMPS